MSHLSVKILPPSGKEQPSDWKELFKEDLDKFPKGVYLRESATLACGRTLPPQPKQPTDAFGHWEKTAPWRWPNRKKLERSQSSFTRRHWEAESAVCGALQNGDPQNIFSENYCDQHPIAASWWWAAHGCEACKKTQEARARFFKDKIAKPDRARFPAFTLQKSALYDVITGEPKPESHPLLRPPSPLKEGPGKKRSAEEERSREKRHLHIVDKFPYRTARKGTDTNPNMWTYQQMKTVQEVQDLCRKWTKPQVAWH